MKVSQKQTTKQKNPQKQITTTKKTAKTKTKQKAHTWLHEQLDQFHLLAILWKITSQSHQPWLWNVGSCLGMFKKGGRGGVSVLKKDTTCEK